MNSEWREVCLGDIFKVKHGFAFKGEFFTDEIQPYALVTPGNFAIGGGFQTQKQKYYRGPVPGEYVLQPGMVVVTMTDLSKQSDTLGYAALVPDDGTIWLHNQRVGLLIFRDPDESDPIFFSYLLRTQTYRAWVVGSATGTTVKHTAPSRIESFRCFVPNIDEQQRIAYALKCLDDKIDLNRRINQTLEAMAQAIFKSWFVDFDPVKAKIAAIEQGQDPLRAAMRAISGKTDTELDQMPREQHDQLAATAALFPDAMEDAAPGSANAASAGRAAAASELGETNSPGANLDAGTGGPQGGGRDSRRIPKGWEVVPLSKMIRLIGGGTPKRSEPSYWGGTIPWFSVKDVPNDGDVWVVDTDEKITAAGLQKSSTKLLRKGTTIISARGTVGKLALVGQEMAMNQSCYGVVGTDGVGDFFNYFNLKFAVEILKRNTHGAVFDTITQATFETVTCVKPGNSVMKQFDEIVEPLLKGIRSNVFQSRELAELRDTLLPKLLSGELSVDLVAEENVQ